MDFVTKTLGSFSLSSSPFSQGEPIESQSRDSIWKLYEGTVRKDGAKCTLFVFDASIPGSEGRRPLAENMARMLRKLRLPGLLKILDSAPVGQTFVVATEPVVPVAQNLESYSNSAKLWGLQNVLKVVDDLHQHTQCVHCNLQLDSVFENAQGEWVLGGFELAGFVSDLEVPWRYGAMLPGADKAAPPEIKREGWGSVNKPEAVDSYQFGVLIRTILGSGAPPAVSKVAQKLTVANPSGRASLKQVTASDAALFNTPLAKISEWAAHPFAINDLDFAQLLVVIDKISSDIPPAFAGARVLPELVKASDAGKGGIDAIRAILKISAVTSPANFEAYALPFIAKLFGLMDRAVRLELLQAMPTYLDKIPDRQVQLKILPAMATGFADTEVLIRRESLAVIPLLATKLSSRQLNGDLLRMLAKTNSDPDPELRAQTVALLADLSEVLDKGTRSSVVVTAMARALKDNSPLVRRAALQGLESTSKYFSAKECAEKLVGPAATALLDSDPDTRRSAQQVLSQLLSTIQAAADALDDGVPRSNTASVVSEPEAPSASTASLTSLFGRWKTAGPQAQTPAGSLASPLPSSLPSSSPYSSAPAVPPATSGLATSGLASKPVTASSMVVEETGFNSGWDDWGEEPQDEWEEPSAAKPAKLAAKPAQPSKAQPAKAAAKPAAKSRTIVRPKKIEPEPSVNLEPEDDENDGWDW